MRTFDIFFKERTTTEGRPGHQWVPKLTRIEAPTPGAALLQLYYQKDVIQPGEIVEDE